MIPSAPSLDCSFGRGQHICYNAPALHSCVLPHTTWFVPLNNRREVQVLGIFDQQPMVVFVTHRPKVKSGAINRALRSLDDAGSLRPVHAEVIGHTVRWPHKWQSTIAPLPCPSRSIASEKWTWQQSRSDWALPRRRHVKY
jgi:hypothetical protein